MAVDITSIVVDPKPAKDIASLRGNTVQAWIDVDDEVKVLARHMPQNVWDSIKAECTTVTLDVETGKTSSTVDEKAFRSHVGRYIVQDISGLVDSENPDDNGQPGAFVATPQNIDLLMEGWTEFRLAIMNLPLSWSRMLDLQREQQKKN